MHDELFHGLLGAGDIRVVAISGRGMAEAARNTHGLSRVCTAALGRTLMMTAILSADLKQETDSLTAILKGDGPAGQIVCTGRYGAAVKGYVANPVIELPPTPAGKLDVGGVVGRHGRLTVIRDLSLKEPYVGECALVSGEIAEDFAAYYATSQQTPSLVYLGVRVKPATGRVLAAGGVLIQPLPGCSEESLGILQRRTNEIACLSRRLEEGQALEAALWEALGPELPLSIEARITPRFQCDCSRERTEQALIALGAEELMSMIEEDGGAELTCHFCHARYAFGAEELSALLADALAPPEGGDEER